MSSSGKRKHGVTWKSLISSSSLRMMSGDYYVCIFSVYALCAYLNDLWNNTCGLVSRLLRLSVMHVQYEVWKVWGGQSVCTTLKEFRGCECSFAPHRTWEYSSFSGWPRALFTMLGTAVLSRTHRSWCGLHGIVAAFTLSSFSSIFMQGS